MGLSGKPIQIADEGRGHEKFEKYSKIAVVLVIFLASESFSCFDVSIAGREHRSRWFSDVQEYWGHSKCKRDVVQGE